MGQGPGSGEGPAPGPGKPVDRRVDESGGEAGGGRRRPGAIGASGNGLQDLRHRVLWLASLQLRRNPDVTTVVWVCGQPRGWSAVNLSVLGLTM